MRRWRVSLSAVAALSIHCGNSGDFVAVETIGDADLRIVLTQGAEGARFEVLTRAEPFRIAASTLEAELGGSGRLPVWIFAFRQSDLVERFAGLEGLTTEQIAELLAPSLEPPVAGRYRPPTPSRVLQAVLTEDGERRVSYQTIDYESVRDDPGTAFTITLDGQYACPPIDRPFRVFARGAPERACVFRRDALCQWSTDRCPDAATFFGPSPTPQARQRPSGELVLQDGSDCAPVDPQSANARRGETDAWSCGARIVAAQRQIDLPSGDPWALDDATSLTNAELSQPSRWAPSDAGAWLAVEVTADNPRLRRILVDETSVSYQPSTIPLPDPGQDRALESVGGLAAELSSGAFRFSVGKGAQCLRLPDGEGDRFLPILATTPTSITLAAPGLGEPLSTSDWAIAGDPGQVDTQEPPGRDDLSLPSGIGALTRISATADQLAVVVHGSARTVRIERVTRVFGARNLFGCPTIVPRPPDLAGAIVAAGRDLFALTTDGVLRMDVDGAVLARTRVDGMTFDDTYRIERRASTEGGDRALVYRPLSETLWLFADAAAPVRFELDSPIVATTDGPQVILRPNANTLVVRDVSTANATSETVYDVPSFSPDAAEPINVMPDAVLPLTGTTVVGLSQGSFVGALDLRTGLSQGRNIGTDMTVETVIADESRQALWLIARESPTDNVLRLVRVPIPPAP